MFCPECGSQIPEGSSFCSSCGTSVSAQSTATQNAASAEGTPQPPSEQPQQAASAAQQPNYQQRGYQQQPTYQQPPVKQKVYANTTGNSRALAMSVYWGLFPLIFCAAAGDKNTDPFIRHHLNQALVILIGTVIGMLLSIIIIGGILCIYLFVMIIMGTVQAYHGEMTELPLIGKIKLLK